MGCTLYEYTTSQYYLHMYVGLFQAAEESMQVIRNR